MRYVLIALLLAGAAWGCTEGLPWEIRRDMVTTTITEGGIPTTFSADLVSGGHVYYAGGEVELAYWYTNWYGEYTEEELRANVKYVDYWEIEIGSNPERPGKFIVWYIGETNSPTLMNPHVKFYVDSLNDIKPTPGEMEDK